MSTTERTGPSFFQVDEIDWADEEKEGAPRELVEEARKKGARRKFLARGQGSFHSQMSEFRAGYVVPMHSHENEQIAYVLEGALKFIFRDHEVVVRAGEMLVIPSDVPHAATALEDTLDLDIFAPARADWAAGRDGYLRGENAK